MPQRSSSLATAASSSKAQPSTSIATPTSSSGPASTLVERRPGSARVRRPPKRLLSPPLPTQPSPSSTASSSSLANSATKTSATSAARAKASSPQSLGLGPSSALASCSPSPSSSAQPLPHSGAPTKRSVSASAAAAKGSAAPESNRGQGQPSGPGKRKRKPSTLRQSPATLAASSSPHTANTSLPAAPARVKSSQAGTHADSLTAKPRIKVRHSTGSALRGSEFPALPEHDTCHGYDSDGNRAALNVDSDVDAEAADFDEADHLEAPPLIFQARKVSFGCFPEHRQKLANKSAKARIGCAPVSSHLWPYASASASVAHAPSGPATRTLDASPQRLRWGSHHARTKSLPSLPSLPTWALTGQQQRSSVDVDERDDLSVAESSDGDEDDFHRAMLDPDFDVFDDDHSSASADLDTPLQTPHSPRSFCDSLSDRNGSLQDRASSLRASCDSAGPSTPRSITSLLDAGRDGHDETQQDHLSEKNDAKPRGRDAVFSHALPLSSQNQRHVGHLTLSLPYHENNLSSPPPGARKTPPASRFMTPILERRATKAMVGQAGLSQRSSSEGQTLADLVEKQHYENGEDGRSKGSTSPTLSPTHAVLGLPTVSNSTASGMAGSPFTAAVHRASLSRSGSPATFNLPPSMMEARAASVASPASTHQDLRDVSPVPTPDEECDCITPAAGKSDAASAGFSLSHTLDGSDTAMVSSGASSPADDASTPLTVYSPVARPCDSDGEDPLFGLPETMDLDDIDVAYGSKGKAHGARDYMASSGQSRQEAQEQHACTSSKDAHALSNDARASSTAQRQSKRSFAELDASPDVVASASETQQESPPPQAGNCVDAKADPQSRHTSPSAKTRRLAATSAVTPETKVAAGPATFPRSTRRRQQQADRDDTAANGSPTARRTRATRRSSISSK